MPIILIILAVVGGFAIAISNTSSDKDKRLSISIY